MPFALIVIGITMTVAAVRGQESQLFDLVKGDFQGPNNFIYWFLAIFAVGALGYIEKARAFSHMFLALILVGLLLHKQGFFSQFQAAIASTQQAASVAPANAAGSLQQSIRPLEALAGLSGVI